MKPERLLVHQRKNIALASSDALQSGRRADHPRAEGPSRLTDASAARIQRLAPKDPA